jgi:hypothetical protein
MWNSPSRRIWIPPAVKTQENKSQNPKDPKTPRTADIYFKKKTFLNLDAFTVKKEVIRSDFSPRVKYPSDLLISKN